MPVGPVDVASLDVDIHGVDADALVTLEGLLVSRMRVAGEQAADLVVVSNVQDLILRAWRDKSPDVGGGESAGAGGCRTWCWKEPGKLCSLPSPTPFTLTMSSLLVKPSDMA